MRLLLFLFSFNGRSENRAQVTYRASLGEPIVPIVVEWRLLVNLYRISMQEIQISMREGSEQAFMPFKQ